MFPASPVTHHKNKESSEATGHRNHVRVRAHECVCGRTLCFPSKLNLPRLDNIYMVAMTTVERSIVCVHVCVCSIIYTECSIAVMFRGAVIHYFRFGAIFDSEDLIWIFFLYFIVPTGDKTGDSMHKQYLLETFLT